MDSLRVLVVQNGARHNYAVPTVLAQAGMLEAFYTDACGNLGIGSWLSLGRHLPWINPPFRRLHQRRVPSVVGQKSSALLGATLADAAIRWLSKSYLSDPLVRRRLVKLGLRGANIVYSSLGWGRPLLEEANARGVPVVTEFYVRPSLVQTYQQEFREFPGWEPKLPFKEHRNRIGTVYDPCTVSNFVVAPSDAVADDIAAIHGFPRNRIEVVPYGIEDSFLNVRNHPIAGRVLFAGTCCLGKGIHYLAMAAETLATEGHRYEFRAAGHATPLVRNQPLCRHLTFLGRVPRNEMQREYESADVLAFPTLSDSFGIVQLEVMAAGIPVVTTRAAGSVVRNGIDGFVVPERDPAALAEAIARIVEDRSLRAQMSAAARERAREYTWDRYGDRLIAALLRCQRRYWGVHSPDDYSITSDVAHATCHS